MIKSMTGYGRNEYNDGRRNIVTEIKSVNHRYNDIVIKMPRRYAFAEEKLRGIIKSIARRGKVDVSILIEDISESDVDIKLNTIAAAQYYENLKELKKVFALSEEINLSMLASMPDVMKIVPDIENEEEIIQSLTVSVSGAIEKFDEMRVIEGRKLAEDILMRGQLIEKMRIQISQLSTNVVMEYKIKIQERIKELLEPAVGMPEDRIALEAAMFADKSNITEELVRLSSHLSQLKKIIESSTQPDGKKLDFLAQEMNREVNTIGSKANDINIINYVLEMKSEIEKIREQIQNVE